MQVLRIEDQMGDGPYSKPGIAIGYSNYFSQPGPHRSTAPFFKHGYTVRFGFSSLNQFHKWWDDKRQWEKMQEHDYKLSLYDVEDEFVIIDEHQATFLPNKAKLIGTWPLIKFDDPIKVTEDEINYRGESKEEREEQSNYEQTYLKRDF